jgi:two-component system, cell cycle response regulator
MKTTTVMVVEDNPLNMKLVRSLLKLNGYQVLEAEDAELAIRLAAAHQPDLILMDIQLPGMDGLEATRIIKSQEESREIPVVALTSYAMSGDEQKAREALCSGYITKPIDTRKFIDTIKGFINNSESVTQPLPKKERSGKPRILIVDDEPLNIKLLNGKLPEGKYETLSCTSGIEAIRIATQEEPDLILLDVMMPDMDGFTVSRLLKEKATTRGIPIILVTALDGLDNKLKGLETGADEFLTKPVNTIELLSRINSLLRLKQYRERLSLHNQSEKSFNASAGQADKPEESFFPAKILIVDDDEKDSQIFKSFFKDRNYDLEWVKSGEEALDLVLWKDFDLILLDVLLPGLDGFEICSRLKNAARTRDIQIILVTCLPELTNKIKGIELGADDYLIKPINSRELQARTKVLLDKKRCMDLLYLKYESALNSAIYDGLTTLYNQTYFRKFFEQEMKRAARQKYQVTLIILDVDNFKEINDSWGHLSGDHILSELGSLIKNNVREIDLTARYGGDEFALVLPYADQDEAIQVAERVRAAIVSHPFSQNNGSETLRLTISIGIASFPTDGSTLEEVIRNADQALYLAKREGKNRFCVHS